ncbi:MAG: efflux RND transporter permease subunit, partial [Planctomycetota bacterium]|nr:efflux RND transporter permease subunit [Planctomycetota bacterium]
SFELDEQKAKLVGLQPVGVPSQLDSNLEGLFAGSVLEGTEEVPVRVRVEGAERGQLKNIESLELLARTPTGAVKSMPLGSLGTMSVVSDRADIPRFNGQRVNTIQAFPKAGTLPQSILKPFLKRLEKMKLPEGYRIVLGGESSERDQAVGSLMASVSLLMVMMAAILVLSFGSFRMAGIIGAVAFLSIGLGLLGLVIFDFPFGFMAIVGTMGLVGVAINDAIVVLAAIKEDPEASSGDPVAIRKVVGRATRHVLSTTLTTMIGFAPLLIAGGGFWPPLAIAIAGGVSGSTLLALTFVPSAYRIVMCQRWFSWIRSQPETVAELASATKTESEDREPVTQS